MTVPWQRRATCDSAALHFVCESKPYYFAFRAITVGLAQKQEEMGFNEPIDFIFDEQTEKRKTLDAWDYLKVSVTANVRQLLGDTPAYKDDEKTLPLQAADLYAWWVRRWEMDGIADGVKGLKFPWTLNRPDLLRLHMSFSEADFRAEFERSLKNQAIVLGRMADPAALLREPDMATAVSLPEIFEVLGVEISQSLQCDPLVSLYLDEFHLGTEYVSGRR